MPFNLPLSITGSNANISGLSTVSQLLYDYDADHTRVSERVISGLNSGTSTIYVGPGFFEVANNTNGTKEYRHYIGGPDGTIGIRTVAVDASNNVLTSGNAQTTRYWFKDHLGSPASEYDAGAINLTPLGFDTWGLRRKNTGANSFTQSLTTADLASYQSPRGYTGHEHLDDVGLIHMNGRIYDPMIGRFMQPDPIISEPYNSQNFNRYAYVLNNPLMYTDPSGYSTWTEIRRPVVAIVVMIAAQWAAGYVMEAYAAGEGASTAFASINVGSEAGEIIGATLTPAGNAVAAAAGGFASGGVSGGNIESAVAGAFQAVALFGVGEALGHSDAGFFKGNHAARIVAHAAIGCVSSGVQGGSCGQGAASAGFAAFAGPVIETENFTLGVAGHAIAGGVGAATAGGKFGNGAITGAFGYLFNEVGERFGKGHHFNAIAEVDKLTKAQLLSPEAEKYMRSSTTGPIPDYSDSKNPHRGSHPEINRRVEQLNNDYVKEKGITAQNKMTKAQAEQLEGRIKRDPQIRDFLDKIRRYQISKAFEFARRAYVQAPYKQPGQ